MSFSYTSSQRKGILFLLFIIGILAIYKIIQNSIIENHKILPIEFISTNKKKLNDKATGDIKSIKELDQNPNTWTKNDWKSIGLSEKQITT